ncbi:MAG: HAD hydrolase family protein [Deltaproteobacteria bacterium]|nr:HAD hydrolase family protein [Deltaproteobacteria bacterium]
MGTQRMMETRQGTASAFQGGNYRWLLVDVDGTLLDSRGHASARTLASLHRAVARGLTLVLATGRTLPSLQRVTAELALPPFAMICNGGAVGLTPGGAVEYTCFLSPHLWPRVVNALAAEGLSPAVYSHRHPEGPLIHVLSEKGDPHFEAYLGRHRAHVRVSPDLVRLAVPKVIQVAALGRGAAFEAASARMLTHFSGEARCHSMVLFINAEHGRITEFFAPEVSKWRAFLGLFPEAATHTGAVVAVGDEANDLEMIRQAGLGIAMGNATPELKAAARRVTADHDHEGLAEAVERVLEEMPG